MVDKKARKQEKIEFDEDEGIVFRRQAERVETEKDMVKVEAEKDRVKPKEDDAVKVKKNTAKKDREESKRSDGVGLEMKARKGWLVMTIIGGALSVLGVVLLLVAFLGIDTSETGLSFPKIPSKEVDSKPAVYSKLTGEVLENASLVDAPAYCIQTPNGTDGARPQVGLLEAGVVFEAIAEAGITRFAAIYQNPTSGVVGPIRSLRIYYLEWDTPFDCTIVHAGGAPDALAAVRSGGYRDLDEGYTYMYRGTYGVRRWNNLFTTAGNLANFSKDSGYKKSEINGFSRMTPEESSRLRVDEMVEEKLVITKAASGNTSEIKPAVSTIALQLGGYGNFNVTYDYDAATNRYLRGYESGVEHSVYKCPAEDIGEVNPEDECKLTQLSPAVVVAMVVSEGKAEDNYHEDIQTIGSGEAYIFQNGGVIKGEWIKKSRGEQIKFVDNNGSEIKLAPGQTFITAVPQYGSVEYQ